MVQLLVKGQGGHETLVRVRRQPKATLQGCCIRHVHGTKAAGRLDESLIVRPHRAAAHVHKHVCQRKG